MSQKCISCRQRFPKLNENQTCGNPKCEAHAAEADQWARGVVSRTLAHYPTGFFTGSTSPKKARTLSDFTWPESRKVEASHV